MKIGDEVYVHGYVDEIRSDVVIIRNEGGYFGTVPSEVNCSEKPNSCETCGTPKHLCEYCIEEDRMWTPKTDPQTDPCDGCVCDDGKHLMYCMNCKGIAWKTEPPKVEDEPQTEDPPMDEYYKDHDELYDCDRYVVTNDEGERAYNCIGCKQTDCAWK